MAIEYYVEEWAKRTLAAQQPENIPAGFQIAHHDEDARANSSRIVLTAKTDEQDLAGPGAYPVTLTAELFVTERDAAKVETIAAAMRLAFTQPGPESVAAAEEFFSYFDIVSQKGEDPESKNDTRKRTRELSILAKEIG